MPCATPQRGQVRHSDIGGRLRNFFGARKFVNVRMSDLTLVMTLVNGLLTDEEFAGFGDDTKHRIIAVQAA